MFYGDHQFEMVAGFVGGLKAGHAYIPVEVGSALPRMQSIIDAANPRLVVAIDDFPVEKLNYDGAVINKYELEQIFAQRLHTRLRMKSPATILSTCCLLLVPPARQKELRSATTISVHLPTGCWATVLTSQLTRSTWVRCHSRLTSRICTG